MTPRGIMFKWIKESLKIRNAELDRMDDLTVLDPLFNLLIALSEEIEIKLILTMIATRLQSIILASEDLDSQSNWNDSNARVYSILKYFEDIRILSDEPSVELSNVNEFAIIINFKARMNVSLYNIVIYKDHVSVGIYYPYETCLLSSDEYGVVLDMKAIDCKFCKITRERNKKLEIQVQDLAMIVKRFCKIAPLHPFKDKAIDYLRRKNLINILRNEETNNEIDN
jgi:hypothetical protein